MKLKGMVSFVSILVCLILNGCGCDVIKPGYVGIKVDNLGSQRGVQNYTVQTGLVTYIPSMSSIFEFPTFVQTTVWTQSKEEGSPTNEEISFNTKEGSPVTGDISLSYQIDAEKVPAFYIKFRSDDLNLFTHGFMRNVARDAFNEVGAQYALEEVYGPKKEELLSKVKKRVNDEVSKYGVILVQFGFVGRIRIDPTIMQALNAKLATTQNAMTAENRLREAQANAANRVAAAEGEARANLALAKSITPELIEWRKLDLTQNAINRWNGVRPMVEGNSSGMLLQLPVGK